MESKELVEKMVTFYKLRKELQEVKEELLKVKKENEDLKKFIGGK